MMNQKHGWAITGTVAVSMFGLSALTHEVGLSPVFADIGGYVSSAFLGLTGLSVFLYFSYGSLLWFLLAATAVQYARTGSLFLAT